MEIKRIKNGGRDRIIEERREGKCEGRATEERVEERG